jgi:ATP-binding cassette subfamily F protein 3
MLKLDHLSLRRGPRLLIEDATLTVHPGHKVGVAGANGCGKSSLLALVRGELTPDAGSLSLPAGWEIAHVAQETPAVATPALEYVMAGDRELESLRSALAAAEARPHPDGTALARLHARLEAIDGYSAESRAARLLDGLGFAPEQIRAPLDSFSGGWRMRLNLARALMCRSDLLLLDEPTNHLDLDAVIWLEAWLRQYPGTLLLISHDREFLDAVVEEIVHIEQCRATLYRGGYSAFERQRAERLAQQRSAHQRQQREVAHMRGFVERFRAKATKARQAQSRLKALERMELIAPAHVDSPFRFAFRAPQRLPNPLLRLEGIGVGYGERQVLAGVELSLAPGDRIGLLGPNGAGKSTLVKLLAGELAPRQGRTEPAQHLETAYFAQHQLEQLRVDESPVWHLQRLAPQASEQELRDFLGGFGFAGERVFEPVAPFSGGEKARLVLALLVYRRPNLLLLDEPTNHLDLDMRLALSQALQDFEGAVVLVSHDRHLLRVTADRLLLVHGGGVRDFDGDLDDYPGWLAQQRQAVDAPRAAAEAAHGAVARKERKRHEAQLRRRLQPLRERLRRLERELDALHKDQAEVDAALAGPALYADSGKPELLRLLERKRELDQRVAEVEEAWLLAGEELEVAEVASV